MRNATPWTEQALLFSRVSALRLAWRSLLQRRPKSYEIRWKEWLNSHEKKLKKILLKRPSPVVILSVTATLFMIAICAGKGCKSLLSPPSTHTTSTSRRSKLRHGGYTANWLGGVCVRVVGGGGGEVGVAERAFQSPWPCRCAAFRQWSHGWRRWSCWCEGAACAAEWTLIGYFSTPGCCFPGHYSVWSTCLLCLNCMCSCV